MIMKINRIYLKAMGVLFALTLFGCKNETSQGNEAFRNVILTSVESIGNSKFKNFSGIVEEGKSVNAAFMTGGKLLTTNVNEGSKVSKGQLIATLDATDYQIGVNQLQIQYDQMVAEKKRMDEMYARHNIAPNDYEKFEAGFEQLRLQLEMARNKLGYTNLYSPTDGFVSFKYMQPGELVDAGTPIYKITDDSKLEVSVDLPLEVYLNRNSIIEAYGKVPNISSEIPLKIESFTPDADNNQLYHMKLGVPNQYKKELTTGMNMTVVIELNSDEGGESRIPSRSIFEETGITYIWEYNDSDSTISKKEVRVTGQPQGKYSLVKGLTGNEKIVAAGVKQLKEGERVRIIPAPVSNK